MVRTVIIGIGGATCSGKTILAKHLASLLGGKVLHQDDFAPAPEDIPYHPLHTDLQDWDDPPTAVLWPQFRTAVEDMKAGQASTRRTREDGQGNAPVEVDEDVFGRWRDRFRERLRRVGGGDGAKDDEGKERDKVDLCVVDGFLLFWDKEIMDNLDVRILLSVPKDLLQSRREGRTYLLENGEIWKDPPGYFDTIVWPAYIFAHKHIATDEDAEANRVKRIEVLSGKEEMTRGLERVCEEVWKFLDEQRL